MPDQGWGLAHLPAMNVARTSLFDGRRVVGAAIQILGGTLGTRIHGACMFLGMGPVRVRRRSIGAHVRKMWPGGVYVGDKFWAVFGIRLVEGRCDT